MAGEFPETWFDTRDGALLIGEAAIEERLIEAGPAVVPLRQLLLAEEFPVQFDDYEKVGADELSLDDYLVLGKWALKILQNPDGSLRALTENYLDRLYLLGLGPEKRAYGRDIRFGSTTSFQEAIGSPVNVANPNKYEDWSLQRYLSLARGVFDRTGRKPTPSGYIDEARPDDAPAYSHIARKHDGFSFLGELIGFTDYEQSTEQELIEWGVDVMKANPDKGFSARLAGKLSAIDRGPPYKLLVRTFTSWEVYAEKVRNTFANPPMIPIPTNEKFNAILTEKFNTEDAVLPVGFDDLTYEAQSEFLGHYLLAKSALGDPKLASNIATRQAAGDDPFSYIEFLKEMRPDMRVVDIKKLATEFGVCFPQSVWGEGVSYLKVG